METLSAYADEGIENVELGYCPDSIDISSLLKTHSFRFVAHNYFLPVDEPFVLNLASPEDDIRSRSINYIKRAIEFCSEHGIDQYTFHAGFRIDPDLSLTFPERTLPPYETAFERFVSSLKRILNHARSYNVCLGVENNVLISENVRDGEPIVLLCEPGEIDRLFDQIGSKDQFGLLLDLGHANVSAATCGFDISRFIEEALPHLVALHLHTNDGTHDGHQPINSGDSIYSTLQRTTDVPATTEAHFDSVKMLHAHLQWLDKSQENGKESETHT